MRETASVKTINKRLLAKKNVKLSKNKMPKYINVDIARSRSQDHAICWGSSRVKTISKQLSLLVLSDNCGSLASLSDPQELHHSKFASTSVNSNNVCQPIDFSAETVISKFQIHRLKFKGWGFLEPFNCLVSQKKSIIRFAVYLLKSRPNLNLGLIFCVNLEKSLEHEIVEAFFNSPRSRISCFISDENIQRLRALMTQLNAFGTGVSGWVVKTLGRLEIKTVCFSWFTDSSYLQTTTLLEPLNCSLLNVVNKRDNLCFLYFFAAALFSFTDKPFFLTATWKTSRSCVSIQSSCQCFYPLFPCSKKRIVVPLMSIN